LSLWPFIAGRARKMLNEELLEKLRERYGFHPLVFHRSVANAKDDSDLFDILDSFPHRFPVVWSDQERRWVGTEDIFMSQDFAL